MVLYSIESEIKNVTNQERGIHNISLDELPYEVWMKHILKAYRKDKERLEQLQRYAKGLEEENVVLQKQLKLLKKQKIIIA